MADLAALPALKTVSLRSNVSGRLLRDRAADIDAHGTESAERAVAAEIGHRTERYVAGLEAYRRHRFRRHSASRPVLWHDDTARLLPRRDNTDGAGRALADRPLLCSRSLA
jgi:hypothetical protein